MAQTVWKVPLEAEAHQDIELPIGAEALCVQVQRGTPCIWFRVDPSRDRETRRFRIAGTGHELGPNVGRYIGTFQVDKGTLVFHVFAIEKTDQAEYRSEANVRRFT